MESQLEFCSLCTAKLGSSVLSNGEAAFCCAGCHAVYHILEARKELGNPFQHPVFRQALQAGLISNPETVKQAGREASSQEIEKFYLEIKDMWCPSCAELIHLLLMQEKGIVRAVVDYSTDLAVIEYQPKEIPRSRITEAIGKLGYQAEALESAEGTAVSKGLWLRLGVAAFCALNAMMFSYPIYATYFDFDDQSAGPLFAWLSFIVSIPVLIFSAWPLYKRFARSFVAGLWGMETLVVIGATASFLYSSYELITGGIHIYFDSMTIIIFFILMGKVVESKAKFSAKDAVLRLVRAVPRKGRKFDNGSAAYVPIKDISPGDLVMVLAGEKFVLDGIVKEGFGFCDESLMTGESVPVQKEKDSLVLAGTVLISGCLTCQVTRSAEESALCRIIDMVQHELASKSNYIRWADPIVKWFVPAVLLIASLAGLSVFLSQGAEAAFLRALSVMLISCPCAIGIAAPLAESQLMNEVSKTGGLIRNRACLQHLGSETVFIFDKTGTVTEGRYSVLSGLQELAPAEKSVLKGMAFCSNHPASKAIAEAILEPVIKPEVREDISGKGVKAWHKGNAYLLGSASLLALHNCEPVPDHTEELTKVYFAKNKKLLGIIILGDSIRPHIREALQRIKPAKAILLSGDAQRPVERIAVECQFDSFYSEKNPLEKREIIETFKANGETVCMVGDGINDAPALSAAHIGISVMSAADISIQVSDVLLTSNKLDAIPEIRRLAKKGRRIIKQNLFWAFVYNVIGIALAAGGLLTPLYAAFAMTASSCIVLVNSRRLKNKTSPIQDNLA